MIPAPQILEMRGECPVHVQLEVDGVQPPSVSPGPAQVVGRVMRVFRGSVAPGSSLTLALDVLRPGDDCPMGDFYYGWERVEQARFLEVFLEPHGDTLRVPTNSCSEIIDELTDAPQLAWSTAQARTGWPARLLRWLARR